jgi:predicted nucleotidyltransferase
VAAIFYKGEKRKEKLRSQLDVMLKKIKSRNICKVILFGSLATGEMHRTSDIDLIIIEESDKRFLDRLDDWYRFLEPDVALDLLVYTPKEISDLVKWNRFIMRAVSEGEVLFEKAA